MQIITWNIQAGRGVDDVVDLARVAAVVRAMGNPDVICLQEVARQMPEIDAGAGADQVHELVSLFPGYVAFFGAALDRLPPSGERAQFGNLVLSRVPVIQCFRHLLPQPADPGVPHMPRQMTEVVVADGAGSVRVMTTHLEYYSASHRAAQVVGLRALHTQVCENVRTPPAAPPDGPYAPYPRPASAILCGDFNLVSSDPEYTEMTAPFADGSPHFEDAWRVRHGEMSHAPTCGVHDHVQWSQGPHCRDFFFVTDDLRVRIAHVEVDVDTDASDHQPVKLVLSAPLS